MDGDDGTHEVTTEDQAAGAVSRGTLRSRVGAERYELGARIGKGGMGEVLAAFDAQIGRQVAIKRMLHRDASDHAMWRFFREASIQGRLDHPAIVPVYELGVDEDGRPFFAMKKLAGTNLHELIAAGHPRQRLLRAFVDVCFAVEFAHTRGVIHRDLKPHNIILGDFGDVYVIDWGIAKIVHGDDEPAEADRAVDDDLATRAGAMIGTPAYMSPEQQHDGRSVDARADVFSLGRVLREILAGDVPPELEAVCEAATAPLARRIASARELAERVQRYLDGDRDVARRQQLALDHLAAARAAFERGDEDGRRVAMREAGRALALDPTLLPAASMVGRLMLDLPTTTPPEVARAMQAHDVYTIAALARASAWSFTGFLWLIPAFVAMAPRHPAPTLALVGAIAVLVAMVVGGGLGTAARSIRLACGAVALVGALAWALSPLVAAPAIAAVIAIALTASPNYTRWWQVLLLAVALSAAALVPWLLAAPIASTDGGILLTAAGLDVSPAIQTATLALSVVGPIVASACLGHAMRRADNDVRRRLHLLAWQLGQLVEPPA